MILARYEKTWDTLGMIPRKVHLLLVFELRHGAQRPCQLTVSSPLSSHLSKSVWCAAAAPAQSPARDFRSAGFLEATGLSGCAAAPFLSLARIVVLNSFRFVCVVALSAAQSVCIITFGFFATCRRPQTNHILSDRMSSTTSSAKITRPSRPRAPRSCVPCGRRKVGCDKVVHHHLPFPVCAMQLPTSLQMALLIHGV